MEYRTDAVEAEFNLAVGTVYRINDLLIDVNMHFAKNDYPNVFRTLQLIFSEISPFILDGKKSDYEEEIEHEIKLERVMAGSYQRQKNGALNFMPSNEVIRKLRAWDRKLRHYMLKYKLYMKMADSRLAASRTG